MAPWEGDDNRHGSWENEEPAGVAWPRRSSGKGSFSVARLAGYVFAAYLLSPHLRKTAECGIKLLAITTNSSIKRLLPRQLFATQASHGSCFYLESFAAALGADRGT